MNFRDRFTVYFVKPVGMDGPIKIGIAADPVARLRNAAAFSPFPLEIIGSVPGRWVDEQFLHECLADHHSHGEWFHSAPLVHSAVEMVLSTGGFTLVRSSLQPVTNIRAKKNRCSRALNAETAA